MQRIIRLSFASSVLLASLVPVDAHAQLGIKDRLRKAAEQAAGRKAGEVVGTPVDPRRYDAATIGTPFDAASLEATLRGLRAMAAQREQSRALVRDAGALATQGEAGRETSRIQRERARIAECRQEWYDQTMHERLEQANRRAHRPDVSDAKIREFEDRYNDRLQRLAKGDTAGANAIARELVRTYGNAPAEAQDEATLAKTCGTPPAGGAGARADSLRTRARELERTATDSGVHASGMTVTRFALARERLLTYASDVASRKPGLWSPEERRLLDGRRSEIEAALRGA